MSALLNYLGSSENILSANSFGENIHVTFRHKAFSKEQLELELIEAGFPGIVIDAIQPGIEDCFIYLMNQDHGNSH